MPLNIEMLQYITEYPYYGLLCSQILVWSEIQEKMLWARGVGNQVCKIQLHFYKINPNSFVFVHIEKAGIPLIQCQWVPWSKEGRVE